MTIETGGTSRNQRERTPPLPTLANTKLNLDQAETWPAAGSALFQASQVMVGASKKDALPLFQSMEACCLRLYANQGSEQVAPEVLFVPVLSESHPHFKPHLESWQSLYTATLAKQKRQVFRWTEEHLITLMVAEAITSSTATTLKNLLNALSSLPDLLTAAEVDFPRLGNRLSKAGWFLEESETLAGAFKPLKQKAGQWDTKTAFAVVRSLLHAFNFNDAPVWLSELIAENAVFPFFEKKPTSLTEAEMFLWLELVLYVQYLSKVETIEHFEDTYERLHPALAECGRIIKPSVPDFSKRQPNPTPRVAFLFFSPDYLAHAKNFDVFLEGFAELNSKPIEPVAYINGNEAESGGLPLPTAISNRGVEIRWFNMSKVTEFLIQTAKSAELDGIDALVFVSTPSFLITSASAGIAPSIIWWAMKYHGIRANGIDGYLTIGSIQSERFINGHRWRAVYPSLTGLYDPTVKNEALQIRQHYLSKGYQCILACIGRAEKINSRPYLEMLQRILTKHPEAVFLWTGRSIPPEVKTMMDELGITERCEFIGWVNTKVYIQVVDIYVDSFPFASGHTSYECMAAGKPFVVLETEEALETSAATTLLPILQRQCGSPSEQDQVIEVFSSQGHDLELSPYVKTQDEYAQRVTDLINNPELRTQCGAAGRKFVEEFLSDTPGMANKICQHLIEVVNAKS